MVAAADRCRSPPLFDRSSVGDDPFVRRRLLAAVVGALLLAVFVVAAQATRQWRDRGCAGVGGPHLPPCVQPAFWHWGDVDPPVVIVGGVVGALLAVGLGALAKRERARRRLWGEL